MWQRSPRAMVITATYRDDGHILSRTDGMGATNKFERDVRDGDDTTYDKAVAVVLRDGRASTGYLQRRLGIGYNRAATLMERMERQGLVGVANSVGKRTILAGEPGGRAA